MKQLLLINPWIYDFAAFDLWMKPVGLLYLAGHLRECGYAVHLIDCLDRYHPQVLQLQGLSAPRLKAYGTGKFFRQRIQIPDVLQQLPFPYYRYGMTEEIFLEMLRSVPKPAAVLITSMMTYWYPGVFRVIKLVKQHVPDVPVLLGGVYARLCPDHARANSGADCVIQEYQPGRIVRLVDEILGRKGSGGEFFDVSPAYDLYTHLDYASILTSIGCPYRCTYCASQLLCPDFAQRDPNAVFEEILHLYRTRTIRNVAFYDDALLVNASSHLKPFLERVIESRLSCFFHTPNGLHVRYITEDLATLLYQAGFKTLRLSLETVDLDRQQQTGGKVTGDEFQRAVDALKHAGFQGKEIGVYLFVGLPGQELQETEATIRYVHQQGVLTSMAEYSPIPGTKDWEVLEQAGYVSSDDDPLIHNNSVFLYLKEQRTFEQIQTLKDLVRGLNARIKTGERLCKDADTQHLPA